MSTKGLRYIQIRENAVREQVQAGTVEVEHIAGKHNPADICTKEDKDAPHYIEMRDCLVSFPPNHRPATINVKEIDSPYTRTLCPSILLSFFTISGTCSRDAVEQQQNPFLGARTIDKG